jgi:hypothetical protein
MCSLQFYNFLKKNHHLVTQHLHKWKHMYYILHENSIPLLENLKFIMVMHKFYK